MELNKVLVGDSLELIKQMGDKSFDLILTDPPYGIGADASAHASGGKNGWRDYGDTSWDTTRPSKEYFDEILRIGKNIVIWGGTTSQTSYHLLWDGWYGIRVNGISP